MCLSLIHCESEGEEIKILKDQNVWENLELWRSYGDSENNWSIANNQMGTGVGALVELIVNSGDANLISKCRERGMEPTDWDSVPQTIDQAILDFFEISDIKFFEMTGQQRSQLAEKTCGLVVTGSKQNPNYGIFDFGEGQNPEDFAETFLSLNKSNKQSIPFVQGKFNQGSTGVLSYCGRYGLKLIVSKRNPARKHAPNGRWGFTIVRRVRPSEKRGTKSSQAFYFCPGGYVPSFEAEGIPVIPGNYPDAYGRDLKYGSYVKLYDFNIGPSLRTQAQFDLNYRLSALLPKPILPIRVFERRRGYSSHTYEATMSGLMVRLEDLEKIDGFPIGGHFITSLGEFKYKIYLLPEGTEKANYTGDDGVVYAVNGQTHAILSRSFFRRKAVKLGYTADSLIVLLYCSALSFEAIEEMFQPSRDRIRDTTETKEVEQQLVQVLASSALLKEINNSRRRSAIARSVQDQNLTQSILQKIIKISPSLNEILVSGNLLKAPFAPSGAQEKAHPKLRDFPTYFKSKIETNADQPKCCLIGTNARFQFDTDAANDYLDRVADPGNFTVTFVGLDTQEWNYSITPNSGLWTFVLDVPENAGPVELAEAHFMLDDISRSDPLKERVFFLVDWDSSKVSSRTGQTKRRPPAPPKQPAINAQPPEIHEIHREGWSKPGIDFDDTSGMCVIEGDEGFDFFVNMDNKFLLTEIKNANPADDLLLKTRFKLGLFLLALPFVNEGLRKNVNEDFPEDASLDVTVRRVTSHSATVILPLIEALSKLDNSELT